MRVCRHLLPSREDAEDAFQATFLVLARKARSIRRKESLASWLHGVARRIALAARRAAGRRRTHEGEIRPGAGHQDSSWEVAWREVQAALDEEIERLADKYRLPFILCCLEGRSRAEAASHLGWKDGTLSSRLDRARKLLQARLARRGVTLSAVLATAVLLPDVTSAAVPATLLKTAVVLAVAHSATPACGALSVNASALADGTCRVLSLTKAKVFAALLGLALVAGLGAWASFAPEGRSPAQKKTPDADRHGRTQAQTNHERDSPRRDSYGDPLPPGAVARMGTIRFRHGGPVVSLAFRPTGKVLASAGHDNSIRIWELSTRKELRRLAPAKGDFADATQVNTVAWSRDGRYLASGTSTRDWTVRLWDAGTGKELRRFKDLRFDVVAVLFSPDSSQLIGGGREGKVCVWDLNDVRPARLFDGGVGEILFLAQSPDGKLLACCGAGISLLDPTTGKIIRLLKGSDDKVRSAAFSPDGKTLVSGDWSHRIRVWDVATGKQVRTISNQMNIAVAFAPDGRMLASVGFEARLWDTTTWKQVRTLPMRHTLGTPTLAFSPDSKILATAGYDQIVRLWNVADGKEIEPPPGHQNAVGSIDFSADGKTLASTSGDGTLRLWDATTGKETGRKGQLGRGEFRFGSSFYYVRFTPDGRHFVAVNDKVHRWDLRAGKELLPLNPTHGASSHVALSADGKAFAAAEPGYTDGKGARGGSGVFVVDLITGKQILRVPGAKTLVGALGISSDGKYMAVGSHGTPSGDTGFIAVWNTLTGKRVWEFKAPKQFFGLVALVFSPDSKILVAGIQMLDIGHRAIVFETATGKELAPFERPVSSLWSAAISPDGKTLATGAGEGGVIRLWEVATRKIRLVLRGEQGSIHALAFSLDGLRLASAGNDTTALIWDLSAGAGKTRLSETELARAWDDLAGTASDAYRAIRTLSAAPEQSIPFLKKLLAPVTIADPQRMVQLLADLSSNRFTARENAARALAKMGEGAQPGLRAGLNAESSLEARQRIERLLQSLEKTTLREARAVEALERMAVQGSPTAHQLLQVLAEGAPDARLTREAGHCLEYCKRVRLFRGISNGEDPS
jgi:RNA polymerase sigma factor (sigma-70 family)